MKVLLNQMLIVKYFLKASKENQSAIGKWLEENKKFQPVMEQVSKELKNLPPQFFEALEKMPADSKAMEDYLSENKEILEKFNKHFQIEAKEIAYKSQQNFKRELDLTDVAEAWYLSNPPKITGPEVQQILLHIKTQADQQVCWFGMNILGALSPDIAKYLLETEAVFKKISQDTVPFGAEPILRLGLQVGYCEKQYSTWQKFIERFLQFSGDTTFTQPLGKAAPAWAIRTILERTQYYKAVQEAFNSKVIREAHLLHSNVDINLLNKIVDQVIKPENHERSHVPIDKSKEAQYLLGWNLLPWLGEEKLFQLAQVAGYCKYETNDLTKTFSNFANKAPRSTILLLIQNTKNEGILQYACDRFVKDPEIAWVLITRSKDIKLSEKLIFPLLLTTLSSLENKEKQKGADVVIAAWVQCLTIPLSRDSINQDLLIRLQKTFNTTEEPEQLPGLLLSKETSERMKDIKNTLALWVFTLQLYLEQKSSDAAILFYHFAQNPKYTEQAVKGLQECASIEQKTTQQLAFASANDITARFYSAMAIKESSQLPKLAELNLERFLQLVKQTSTTLRQDVFNKKFLSNLPTLLTSIKDKKTASCDLLSLYVKTFEIQNFNLDSIDTKKLRATNNNEDLFWLTAIYAMNNNKPLIAAELFYELAKNKKGDYSDKATKYLLNLARTEVPNTSTMQQQSDDVIFARFYYAFLAKDESIIDDLAKYMGKNTPVFIQLLKNELELSSIEQLKSDAGFYRKLYDNKAVQFHDTGSSLYLMLNQELIRAEIKISKPPLTDNKGVTANLLYENKT